MLAIFRCSDSEAGFSLAETIVATAIMTASIVSLAQLFAISTASNRGARYATYATVLAYQKMEQIRGLTFGFDTIGLPLTDITTDLASNAEPTPASGSGLGASPATALRANTSGFVDYIDATGKSLGGGSQPPTGTVYIRRWAIEPLPTNPNNTLVIQVFVTTNRSRGTAEQGSNSRMPDEARIVSIKTRKAQ